MITRRIFLAGSIGALATNLSVPGSPLANEPSAFKLTASSSKASLLEDPSVQTDIWAYDGQVPGPVIRVRKGEEISIEVINQLDQPTTIHWHGIRIDNAMDGVAGLTQPPIQPGESFIYRFTPPDAGTYWYHPHNRTWEQLARGLYGTLIVEGDANDSDFDGDHSIMVDDWRLGKDGLIDEASFGALHDWAHAGRFGNILTLNGKHLERLNVRPGDRVRLRFINAANARPMRFAIDGHSPLLIALDGQAVEPKELGRDGISLAPAQRADLLVDIKGQIGDEIAIVETSGQNRFAAGYLVCSEEKSNQITKPVFTGLAVNPLAPPKLEEATELDLVMTGGAMRFLENAVFKGEELDGRTLAQKHKQLWAFNGIAGMAEKPYFSAKLGETIKIKIANDTGWPHAIHVHGHHFNVLSRENRAQPSLDLLTEEERNAWRDTVLLERDEIVEIAFVADNPGKWMLHCHMLEHQASGMGTWFEVI